mmetsp:Transcript_2195/g.7934  ORF Transcript_2195/g.7934 Transcript_2195/m.7934 type:complete len:317 (+) Transcript_2195:779-1729(+)
MLASLGWRWWMLVAMVDAHFVRWRLAAGGLCGVTGGTALFISEGGGDRLPELGSPACSSSQSSTTAMSMISGSSETTSDIPHVAGAPHVEMRRGGSLASAKGMMHLRSVVRAHPRELDVLEVLDLVLRQRAEVDDELPPRLAECARRRRERESAQKVSARSSRRPWFDEGWQTRSATVSASRTHFADPGPRATEEELDMLTGPLTPNPRRFNAPAAPPFVPRDATGAGARARAQLTPEDDDDDADDDDDGGEKLTHTPAPTPVATAPALAPAPAPAPAPHAPFVADTPHAPRARREQRLTSRALSTAPRRAVCKPS